MRGTPIVFEEFSGGVNLKAGTYGFKTNECQDCLNVVSTKIGTITKRNGSQTISSSFSAANFFLYNLYCPSASPNSPFYIVALGSNGTSGYKIYKITSAGTVTDITGTMGSPATSLPWGIAEGPPGLSIYFNTPGAAGNPQKWDQTAGTTSTWTASTGTVPRGKTMVYHGDRMWVGGNPTNSERLLFSNLDDPSDWPASNYVDIDIGSTGSIQSIVPFGPYLLVFKDARSYLVYDLDTGANRQVSASLGVQRNQEASVTSAPEGVYFLSNRSTVELFNGQTFTTVSEAIAPLLLSWFAGGGVASGTYYQNHYYLSRSAGFGFILDYDVQSKAWWIHSCTNPYYTLATHSTLGVIASPLVPGAAQARVDQLFVSGLAQDLAVNYNAFWSSPWMSMGQPELRKRLRKIHIDGKGTVDLSLAKDFGSYVALGSNILATSVTETEANVFTPGVARTASIKLGSTANDDFEIDAMTIAYGYRKN